MDESAVMVTTAQGEVEEQQLRAFLAAHGIPSWVRGEALRHTHSLTLDGLGAVHILVAPGDAERARELLAAVERGEYTLDEDMED